VVNRVFRGNLWVCAAFAALALGPASRAQEAEEDPLAFWDSKDRSRPAAAAQVAGLGQQPFMALALRTGGQRFVVWDEVGFVETFAPELNPKLLEGVQDRRWLPNIAARPRVDVPAEDLAHYRAYSEALVRSFDTPLDAFQKSAEENKHVTFAHLMSTPNKYRGKVIPIKGKLVRLRREDPTLLAQQNGGLKDVYVGWVFGPTAGSNPFCVQFPMLPEGLEPNENLRQDVTFFGYFISTFKYEGGKGRDDRPTVLVTPLLVGRTLVLAKKDPEAVEAAMPLPIIVLGSALSFVMFLSVVFFVMYFWMQRSDQRVLSKLDAIKVKNMPAPFINEPDPAAEFGTVENPAPSQLVFDNPGPAPEAMPVDPERN
jgi:hypothetical protein